MKSLIKVCLVLFIATSCTSTVTTPKVAEEIAGDYWASKIIRLEKKTNKATTQTAESAAKSLGGVLISKSTILDDKNAAVDLYLTTNGLAKKFISVVMDISRTKSKTGTTYAGTYQSDDNITIILTIVEGKMDFSIESATDKTSLTCTKK